MPDRADQTSGDLNDLGSDAAVASLFAKARSAGVPTFAPKAFARALETWRSSPQNGEVQDSSLDARRRVEDELMPAFETARRSKDILGELSRRRTDILRGESERRLAPDSVAAGDQEYQLAIEAAERGEAQAARDHAAAASERFRNATVDALVRGPLRWIESAVTNPGRAMTDEAARLAEPELVAIRDLAAEVRADKAPVSALRERLHMAGRRFGTPIGDLFDPLDDIRWPDPFPGDPGYRPAPEPVRSIRVTGRSVNQLSLTWLDGSNRDEANVLLRQEEGGPWEAVATYGALTGWTSHTDTGLKPDTLYCYRVRSENERGSVLTPLDQRGCGYTRDGNRLGVWRVQLRVRTADVTDAGTTNPIQARLTSPLPNYAPNGNRTWLDYGPRWVSGGWRDDFARGRDFKYDLDTTYVRELSDITMLTIEPDGSDAVGIASIALIVNGVEVFQRYFGDTASTCLWVQGGGYAPGYTVTKAELRAHPSWQAYVASPPAAPWIISNSEIVSRIEGIIGNLLHGRDVRWGEYSSPAWVEATAKDPERLTIDVDLEAEVPVIENPEIDLSFDLRFSVTCDSANTATLRVVSENVNANVDLGLLTELFGTLVLGGVVVGNVTVWAVEEFIAAKIEASFEPIAERIEIPANGKCPTVRVTTGGDIALAPGE